MRVLITTDVVGGVWTYTEELVDALAARGHTLALVALGGQPRPAQRAWAEERRWLQFYELPSPLEWMPEPEPGLSASAAALRRIAEEFEPDVVHLNQFFYGAHELAAPKLVVAHSDVLSWWRVVKREQPPNDDWFRRYRAWVRDGLAGAHARAAPSAWMAAQVEEIYGAGSVDVVHNARSPAGFEPLAADAREPVILAAGRLWDEAKGARDLIPAAARLDRRLRVLVAGPVEHPGGGEDFPAAAPGIEWLGVLEPAELRRRLARAAVYAATSHYEPFGLAPLEAALAGCALVAADIPTFRELWAGCAAFYPPGDAAALADAASSLLEDHARRRTLARSARARAVERYAPERMAAEYERIYQTLAGPPSPSPSPANAASR